MSGGTFEKLFGAWTDAEADLYEALDHWPSEHCTEWEERFRLMKAIADERYAALFGARRYPSGQVILKPGLAAERIASTQLRWT